MNWARLLLACAVVVLFSCDKEPQEATRSFRMGFTSVPRRQSSKVAEYTFQQLALASDITNHQFTGGVPWQEAFSGSAFATAVTQDWMYRRSLTPSSHKVLVSVSPLSADGSGIAKYLGDGDNMKLIAPWDKYTFNDEAVRVAYLNYCRRLISFFNPEFFNMSAEANVLYLRDPSQWKQFLSFHKFVYENLKNEFPGLVVFSSVSAAQMVSNGQDDYDPVMQKLAVLQIMENSDLYALTFKPGKTSIKNYNDNTFSSVFNISNKPLAVAETGFELQSVAKSAGGVNTLQADPQPIFMNVLLKESEVHKASFIINVALQDHENILQGNSMESRKDLLYNILATDRNGMPKQPVAVWSNYQKRTYKP